MRPARDSSSARADGQLDTAPASDPSLRRELRASTTDGTLYCVMVGVGESYLALFALAAGLGEVVAGLITTVPLLLGAVIQLIGPRGARWVGSHRRWIVLCAAVQAASFIPIAAAALIGTVPAWVLFLSATIYWGGGMACGASWSTWIGMIVPRRIRARYFGRRSRIANLGVLVGLVGGGLVLHWAAEGRDPAHGGEGAGGAERLAWFAALFIAAGLCRGASAAFLWSQRETGPVPESHRVVRGVELLGRLRRGRDGRFILYLMFMTMGVHVAQPYFTPYMREQLQFSYGQVLTLVGASFVAKGLAQPLWGLFAHRFGAVHLLWIGGVGLIPLPVLWLVSDSWGVLIAAQMVSGAMWGAYELASFLLLVEATREEERTSLWATYNLLSSTAMVLGSVVGAKLLREWGLDRDAYATVFWVSVAARLATIVYLTRTHEVLRRPATVVIGVDAVRPTSGSIDKPIIVGGDDEQVSR